MGQRGPTLKNINDKEIFPHIQLTQTIINYSALTYDILYIYVPHNMGHRSNLRIDLFSSELSIPLL